MDKPIVQSFQTIRITRRTSGLLLVIGLIARQFVGQLSFASYSQTISLFRNEESLTPNLRPRRKFESLEKYLEETNIRYFVYNDSNITLPHLRYLVQTGEKPTWTLRWGTRYFDYTKWDLIQIQALENHPLRTLDPNEADFFFVPIPFGASIFWQQKGRGQEHALALKYLFNNKLYQQFSFKRHVLLTSIEHLFSPFNTLHFAGFKEYYDRVMRDFTIVRFDDVPLYQHGLRLGLSNNDFKGGIDSSGSFKRLRNTWSISFSGGACGFKGDYPVKFLNLDALLQNGTLLTQFHQRRINFFFRVTSAPFLSNSTIYRRAICNASKELTQPSSVGYDIKKEQWVSDFSSSKFCPALRGDNPLTRSLARSIRNGCIPIIVSDLLPYYAPTFRSIVKYSDYAIVLREDEVLANASKSMNEATAGLSQRQLQDKLEGLAFMQRLIVVDHPRPLFVQAFCRETIASFHPNYTNYSLFQPY